MSDYLSFSRDPPRVSVWLNEVQIHDEVEIQERTSYGFLDEVSGNDGEVFKGPIRPQADASRVRFANVWLVPLETD